jgi:hypothetical protein
MTTINTVAAGLHHGAGHSEAAVGVVAEGPAVKQAAAGVPVASPILSASTVVKLGAASIAPLTYDAALTNSVEHLRVGIAKYLGHGA